MLSAEFYLYNNNVLYFKYTVITNTLITEIDSSILFIITRVNIPFLSLQNYLMISFGTTLSRINILQVKTYPVMHKFLYIFHKFDILLWIKAAPNLLS